MTPNGVVKKTMFNAYDSSRQDGLIAINLRDGDELVRVMPTSGDDDILLVVTEAGQGIRFSEDDVRPMGRTASGVQRHAAAARATEWSAQRRRRSGRAPAHRHRRGLRQADRRGEFNRQGRGGQGVRAHKLHADGVGSSPGSSSADEDEVLLINDAGVVIRTGVGGHLHQGRDATGVRVMNLDDDTKVAAVARVLSSEDGSDEDDEDRAPRCRRTTGSTMQRQLRRVG